MYIKDKDKNKSVNERQEKEPSRFNLFAGLTRRQKIIRSLAISYVFIAIFALAGIVYATSIANDLPSVDELVDYKYNLPTIIYDDQGSQIFEYFDQKRILIDDDKIPKLVKDALIASEDTRFESHFGIDPIRILKAAFVNLINFRIVQGASTITQQTAKLYFLTPEKTLKRKISEILLAIKLEKNFSKEKILGFYLNKAFFGRQSYGIGAAAMSYFNKTPAKLTLAETATLIGLLPAPSRYSPTVNIDAALARRNIVLNAMYKNDYITEDQYNLASAEKLILDINQRSSSSNTSFFTEEVRRYLVNKYGVEKVIKGGLKVYTTLNLRLQNRAQQALQTGLLNIQKRHGYPGPVANINAVSDSKKDQYEDQIGANEFEANSLVLGRATIVNSINGAIYLGQNACGLVTLESSKWMKPFNSESLYSDAVAIKSLDSVVKSGDYLELKVLRPVNLSEAGVLGSLQPQCRGFDKANFLVEVAPTPKSNGAILAVNYENGHVLAMSGGYSFGKSQFNRVLQSLRPTGSLFKPIVYLSALSHGYNAASILDDSPISFGNDELNNIWIPKNYSRNFSGLVSFRNALVFSKNIPTVRLASDIGIGAILSTTKQLLIDTKLIPTDLSASLGSGSVNLWEMTRAYTAFATKGVIVDPVFILKVYDRDGVLLEDNYPTFINDSVNSDDAFVIDKILHDVNTRGTGASARALGIPSAGKTGTTNDNSNAWFVGYIPQVIAGVYVGNDDFQTSLGTAETGTRAAQPIWIDFMQAAKTISRAEEETIPPTITAVDITSNGKLYCGVGSTHSIEYFKLNDAPTVCDSGAASNYGDLTSDEDSDPETSAAPSTGPVDQL